jgi:hypothetical protein
MGGLMKKSLYLLLFAFCIAFSANKKSVAILPTEGDALSDNQVNILTGKMREAATKVLTTESFDVVKQETIYNRLGGEDNYIKIVCTETNCILNLGKKAKVDYVAQCRVVQDDGRYWMTVELYEVSGERQLGTFTKDAATFDDLTGLIDQNVPSIFEKIPGASVSPQVVTASPGEFKFGVRAGFSVNNFSFGYKDLDEGVKMGLGYAVGAVLNVPLVSLISLNIGLDFYYRTIISGDFDGSEIAISIPALFQFGNSYNLAAGIQLDIPLSSDFSASREVDSREVSISMDRSPINVGLVLGLGYRFLDFGFDFRYVYGLAGLFDELGYYENDNLIGSDKDKSWLGQYCFGVSYFF